MHLWELRVICRQTAPTAASLFVYFDPFSAQATSFKFMILHNLSIFLSLFLLCATWSRPFLTTTNYLGMQRNVPNSADCSGFCFDSCLTVIVQMRSGCRDQLVYLWGVWNVDPKLLLSASAWGKCGNGSTANCKGFQKNYNIGAGNVVIFCRRN